MSDFKENLHHPIAIEGIEVYDDKSSAETKPEIMITRSLPNNSRSKSFL